MTTGNEAGLGHDETQADFGLDDLISSIDPDLKVDDYIRPEGDARRSSSSVARYEEIAAAQSATLQAETGKPTHTINLPGGTL